MQKFDGKKGAIKGAGTRMHKCLIGVLFVLLRLLFCITIPIELLGGKIKIKLLYMYYTML